MIMEIINFLVGLLFTIGAFFFMYMSSHVNSERKLGKTIPLPWEKNKRKIFNKSDIKYRDGDNT